SELGELRMASRSSGAQPPGSAASSPSEFAGADAGGSGTGGFGRWTGTGRADCCASCASAHAGGEEKQIKRQRANGKRRLRGARAARPPSVAVTPLTPCPSPARGEGRVETALAGPASEVCALG